MFSNLKFLVREADKKQKALKRLDSNFKAEENRRFRMAYEKNPSKKISSVTLTRNARRKMIAEKRQDQMFLCVTTENIADSTVAK